MSEAVLLKGVKELLHGFDKHEWHPGLALDKFSAPGKQETQKGTLDQVCNAGSYHGLLKEIGARRDAMLAATGADKWNATTSGPLTLHLSRANALENAGIALHPLYGFAYLPGSGLKGAARAYAETIWLPAQPNQKAASRQIIAVFGCTSDNDKERQETTDGSAGAVVFHDAWPETWPKLFVDIAAIHHPEYYQAAEGKVPPPGDWETPTLVSFLAIPPGTNFRFALAPRVIGKHANAAAVGDAKQWLNGALSTLGVGAKTAAGYGLFKTETQASATTSLKNRVEVSYDLMLITPAFLAGGAQDKEDCDLRGATLRGQLRWWWRTMHAAHLAPAILRRLEAAVWGASSQGSAVQLKLEARPNAPAHRFDFNADRDGSFLKSNAIERSNEFVAENEKRKTTQGLYYAAYGAGKEMAGGIVKPGRFFRQPGSTWKLRLAARKSIYCAAVENVEPVSIEPMDILRQANAALFLLTRYGGVGAKARKGFGCLSDIPIDGITGIGNCKEFAREFRARCGLASEAHHDAPSLEVMSDPVFVPTTWTNAWFALNRIGEAMQDFAKTGKHQLWKSALGIPRKSEHAGATASQLKPKIDVLNVNEKAIARHAAPIHYHVAKPQETLEIRLVTFVSRHLPDERTSRQQLGALRTKVQERLEACANEGGRTKLWPASALLVVTPDDGRPRVGGRVRAELLAERTKKGGWKAKDITTGDVRSIQNTHMVPADKTAGDTVELEVPNNAEFKWPVAQSAPPPPAPRHGGPRGRR